MKPAFWSGKRVFLTGHTGFKGSWLSLWLQELGAEVCGYSDGVPTDPPFATTAWTVATDRALPCPLAAPMSARRHSVVDATAASGCGPLVVRTERVSYPFRIDFDGVSNDSMT